ncbi:MAG: hypothetical protein R2716_05005 [Microthrixaceae bacterium]
MRWPSPSFYDHVKHLTTGRDQPLLGAPNEGVFTGLRMQRSDGSVEFAWLRDLEVTEQRFASDRTDTVATTYLDRSTGVVVELHDTVDASDDVLARRHVVRVPPGSGIESLRLVAFANLQVTHQKYSGAPIWDGCLDQLHDSPAHYGAACGAVVQSSQGRDPSGGRRSSAAAAIGWAGGNDAHDVASDTAGSALRELLPARTDGAYASATGRLGELAGRDSAGGQVDMAVARDLDPGPDGTAEATFLTAFGADADAALGVLGSARSTHDGIEARKASWFDRWLAGAELPNTDDPDVLRHAQRALVVLRQAYDDELGGVVASISTQPPYNMAWVRDDLYFAEAMKAAGHPEAAESINRFHARTLVRSDQRPPGAGDAGRELADDALPGRHRRWADSLRDRRDGAGVGGTRHPLGGHR